MWRQQLVQGAQQLNIRLTDKVIENLLRYLILLEQWNRVYNLTAVKTIPEMVTRHLLDSLAVRPYLFGERILDVGSGAGLPGIPLAMVQPESQFTLLDKSSKKTRFLLQARHVLALPNVSVVQQRVENYQAAYPFTSIITRAFGTMADTLEQTRHLRQQTTCYVFMKGQFPQAEFAELPAGWTSESHPLSIPFMVGERHVIIVKRQSK